MKFLMTTENITEKGFLQTYVDGAMPQLLDLQRKRYLRVFQNLEETMRKMM